MKDNCDDRIVNNEPMTQELCKTMINRKMIKTGISGTDIYIHYDKKDAFCRLLKMYQHPKTQDYFFDVELLEYDKTMRISHEEITLIDGMTPNDLASACDIDVNGKLLAITISDESNLNETLLGQENAVIQDEVVFNGMKITPMFDVDESLREQTLIVQGVGESISFKKNRGRPRTAYKNKD